MNRDNYIERARTNGYTSHTLTYESRLTPSAPAWMRYAAKILDEARKQNYQPKAGTSQAD